MHRVPPAAVRRELRREVGYGCPVPGCESPYLQWHHFDPPWRERQHHEPNGMVALCQEHHDKADAETFTKDQLREFKEQGAARSKEVKGRFDWLRRDLLAVVGGMMYYDTPIIFNLNNQPIIWFTRDEDGYMLLNVRMVSTSEEARMVRRENFWLKQGTPEDLESPPHGKLLRVKYSNGDYLKVEFFEFESALAASSRYSEQQVDGLLAGDVTFPLTAVEVHNRVAGANIDFGPRKTRIGNIVMTGGGSIGSGAALIVGPADNISSNLTDRWHYDPNL